MASSVDQARQVVDAWHLGKTSSRYETGGRGVSTISSGRGDHGGVSYGAYQLSTNSGTLREYLDQSAYKDQFDGLAPASEVFNAKWRELSVDPGFAAEQHEFIRRSHYDVQLQRLQAAGIDLSDRGRAVQDSLWSTSVQLRGLTRTIVSKGLTERFGQNYDLSQVSDKEIVESIQDYKISHNNTLFRSSKGNWEGLLRRAREEREELSQLASHEQLLAQEGLLPDWKLSISPSSTNRRAMGGNAVSEVQANLNKLHIPDAQGRQLVADGNAGPRTQQAIESFQRQHGMPVDGKATPQLLSATQIAVSVTEALSSSQQFSREYSAQPNTPPGWAGVPHAASTQAVHVPRSAERTASTERVAEAAQFDGVRVRVDSTEQLHPRQMARAPVATSVSELDRDAVVSLQRDLNRLGFTDPRGRPLAEDGHHGPNTQAAVSAFQREQGLPPTGMADPVTLSAVNAHAIVANLQQQRDERETIAAFQAQARAFDAQQAGPRLPDQDPLGRETATLHAARSTQASGFGELHGTYLPPSGGSPAVDVVRSSGRVADALDHTAMRHVERGPHRPEAASNAITSAEPASMRDARDPQHPDHAFYRAIADKLPGAYAEAGLSVPGREAQERVAASLSAQARSQGVVSADHVVIGGGEQGNIFVVQGRLDDPAHLRTHLPLQEAQSAPLQESFQQLQQASQQLARDQQAEHEYAQQRAQGAAMSM